MSGKKQGEVALLDAPTPLCYKGSKKLFAVWLSSFPAHVKLSESKNKVSVKGDFRLHGGNVRFPPGIFFISQRGNQKFFGLMI